jgi:hypothetical protein
MQGSPDWFIYACFAMGWADWMCPPEPSLAAELQLEFMKRAIKSEGVNRPESLAELACKLIEQDALKTAMLKGAVERIAELEEELAIADELLYQMEG